MKTKRIVLFIIFIVSIFFVGFLLINNANKVGIASLVVNSNILTDVYVNGKKVGKTPYEGTMSPDVTIVKVGNYETKVSLQPGIKTILNRRFNQDLTHSSGEVVSFEKTGLSNGTLAVVSDPGGAQVRIDNISYNFTPINIDNLSTGIHQLSLVADQYENVNFPINIVSGYKLIASIDLSPKVSILATASPQPTMTATPIKLVQILSTPNGFLRVRKEPTTASDEIGQVHTGEEYELVESDKKTGWFEIKLSATSSGWISNTYSVIKP